MREKKTRRKEKWGLGHELKGDLVRMQISSSCHPAEKEDDQTAGIRLRGEEVGQMNNKLSL